jgi:hypothetical protein
MKLTGNRAVYVAPVLVAAAIVLALFASDLRAWPDALRSGDVRAAAGQRTTWRPSTTLPSGWSEGLLGLRSDLALRLGIEGFEKTYALPPGLDSDLTGVEHRDIAEARLAALTQDSSPQRASQALDLLGLMLFGDAAAGVGAGATTNALGDLEQAVRLDDRNTDAKTNLELMLRLLAGNGTRPGSAAATGPRSTGHHGAGSGSAGEGY